MDYLIIDVSRRSNLMCDLNIKMKLSEHWAHDYTKKSFHCPPDIAIAFTDRRHQETGAAVLPVLSLDF